MTDRPEGTPEEAPADPVEPTEPSGAPEPESEQIARSAQSSGDLLPIPGEERRGGLGRRADQSAQVLLSKIQRAGAWPRLCRLLGIEETAVIA